MQLMHAKVQKWTSTTLPRSDARVSGSLLIQAVMPVTSGAATEVLERDRGSRDRGRRRLLSVDRAQLARDGRLRLDPHDGLAPAVGQHARHGVLDTEVEAAGHEDRADEHCHAERSNGPTAQARRAHRVDDPAANETDERERERGAGDVGECHEDGLGRRAGADRGRDDGRHDRPHAWRPDQPQRGTDAEASERVRSIRPTGQPDADGREPCRPSLQPAAEHGHDERRTEGTQDDGAHKP